MTEHIVPQLSLLLFISIFIGCDGERDTGGIETARRSPTEGYSGSETEDAHKPGSVDEGDLGKKIEDLNKSIDRLAAEVGELRELLSNLNARPSGKKTSGFQRFGSTKNIVELRKTIRRKIRELKGEIKLHDDADNVEASSDMSNKKNRLERSLEELEKVNYEEDYLDWKDRFSKFLRDEFGILCE